MDQWDERKQHLGPWPVATLPVALLPLRLESRFDRHGATPLLKVRAYPDDLHLDSHEPELTTNEQQWGQHYWQQCWTASLDDSTDRAAWCQLAERFGPGRAAWIRQALTPTNLADLGSAEPPQFPVVPERQDVWTRAPYTKVLPERLAVLGYRGGQRVLCAFGEPIPALLPVGPDPSLEPPEAEQDPMSADPGLHWLVDYAEAESQGMAVTIPLMAIDLQEGFDTLLVLGLKSQGDGAPQLTELLAAQHYTDGLAFVPQGTPTNNTPAAASGYASRDPGQQESFGAEVASDSTAFDVDANAAVTAAALGLDPTVLAHIAYAQEREQADARHIQGALWATTWGYFLEQMRRGVLDEADLESLRQHYLEHVRARGPLPALRVGRQPYGVLPVLPLDSLTPSTPLHTTLVGLLQRLRDVWREAVQHVPRLQRGSAPATLGEHLQRVLEMGALSDAYQARLAVPDAVYGDPQVPGFTPQLPGALVERLARTQETLRTFGGSGTEPLGDLLLLEQAFPFHAPLVQDAPLSWTEPLTPNYITQLRTADYDTLKADLSTSRNLLYMLLRHSVLLEYARCVHRILVRQGDAVPEDSRDPALIDILSASTRTVGRVIDDAAAALRNGVQQSTAATEPEAARLEELHAHLRHLEAVPSARLPTLLAESLDLASHRLDAWCTAQATRALAELRTKQPQGVYLGGYGVVQDLRPDPQPTPVPTLPPGEEVGTLYEAGADHTGFLHAPSLPQAVTGAVLRSGYLAHRSASTNGATQPLALDLSSARVRLAQGLLEGVRQGQSLGALLGYRFERGLSERGLAQYLEAFRVLAPFGDYYKLEAAKRDRITTEVGLLTEIQEAERTTAQGTLDGLLLEVNALIAEINSKTATRAALQNDLGGLNTRITAKQQEIDYWQGQVEYWQGRVYSYRNDPPTSERLLEAQAELAGARFQLAGVQADMSALVSQRNTKQGQISALTTAINTLQNEDLPPKQASLSALERDLDVDMPRRHEQQRLDLIASIEADMQPQFDALLQHYRDTYLYPPATVLQAMETIATQRVTDGLILLQQHRANDIPWGEHGLPPAEGSDHRPRVEAELALLVDTVDAVSDVMTAEALHQTIQGNPTRAGAALDAVASGEVPPPELEYLRTPRSGVAATHRLLVLFTETPSPTPLWTVSPGQARAAAEPWLNAWAARLLGDPVRVSLRGEVFDPESGTVHTTVYATLADLGLCPLDVVYGAQGDAGGEVAELVRYHLRRVADSPQGAALRLLPEREPDQEGYDVDMLSLTELLELARAAAQLIAGGRTLEPRDLQLPGDAVGAHEDVAELAARADAAAAALSTASNRLETLLAAGDTVDLEVLREALLNLSYLGLPGAVPRSVTGTAAADREALREQATDVAAEAARRLGHLQEFASTFEVATATPEAQRRHQQARLQAVLGEAFTALVRLHPDATLALAFAASTALQDNDPLAATTWLLRMARVRERSAQLGEALGYAEAVGNEARLQLTVAQLPHQAGERWIALPPAPDQPLPAGRVSLVAHCPDGPPAGGAVAGLLVDEWTEVVPGGEETTGLAFHFDAPGTEPPQAILLAVPPDTARPWDLEDLAAAVLDTLELARLRAVDLEALAAGSTAGDVLPAIYLAHNPENATVSTDFVARAEAR